MARKPAKKSAKKSKTSTTRKAPGRSGGGGGGLRYNEQQILARLNDACNPYSYIDLARASGMSRETIRRQLIGMSVVSVELVCEVCRFLNLSADWILFGRGKGPGKR